MTSICFKHFQAGKSPNIYVLGKMGIILFVGRKINTVQTPNRIIIGVVPIISYPVCHIIIYIYYINVMSISISYYIPMIAIVSHVNINSYNLLSYFVNLSHCRLLKSPLFPMYYPLVNVYVTMENHHF